MRSLPKHLFLIFLLLAVFANGGAARIKARETGFFVTEHKGCSSPFFLFPDCPVEESEPEEELNDANDSESEIDESYFGKDDFPHFRSAFGVSEIYHWNSKSGKTRVLQIGVLQI